MKLTKEELQTIINLLFAGKFGFSAQENDKVIVPIINKLSKMMDELPKEPVEVEEAHSA